jgi:hypothetical protein
LNALCAVALIGLVILDGKKCDQQIKNKNVGCRTELPYPHKLNELAAVLRYDMFGSFAGMEIKEAQPWSLTKRLVEKLLSVVMTKCNVVFLICYGKFCNWSYERAPNLTMSLWISILKRSKADFFWELWTCFYLLIGLERLILRSWTDFQRQGLPFGRSPVSLLLSPRTKG